VTLHLAFLLAMRILTFNIHGWRTADGRPNLSAVADVITTAQADIVGLNEVHHPRVVEGDERPALEALAARLDLFFVFGPCLRWPAQENMPPQAYGNALLSRWPIIASAGHHLTPKEEDAQGVLEGKEQRGLLEGRILLPNGHSLTVYVTHLDHTSEEARLVQLRVARTWLVRDRNRPHLVLGDFNAIHPWDFNHASEKLTTLKANPLAAHMAGGAAGPRVIAQMEKAGYVDLYQRFGPPGAKSFLTTADHPMRIDYIFASQSLAPSVTSCAILADFDHVSDHRPILAQMGWPAEASVALTDRSGQGQQ
jgi:endonuclease/exonuclease/phosphatase family metal-dependent hydrolase